MSELYAIGGNVRGQENIAVQAVVLTGLRKRLVKIIEPVSLIMLLTTIVGIGLMVASIVISKMNNTVIINRTPSTYTWHTVTSNHGFFTTMAQQGWVFVVGLFLVTALLVVTGAVVGKESPKDVLSAVTFLGFVSFTLGAIAALLGIVIVFILGIFGVGGLKLDSVDVDADVQRWLSSSMSNPPKVNLYDKKGNISTTTFYGYNRAGKTITTYQVKIFDGKVKLQQVR